METLYAAIAIFGMAAILGMYLLSLILRKKTTPKGVTIIHGLFAVTALVLLIVYCVGNRPSPWESVVVFVLAASGGGVMVYRDLTGRRVPPWLAIGHGMTAIIGFAMLIWFVYVGDGAQ